MKIRNSYKIFILPFAAALFSLCLYGDSYENAASNPIQEIFYNYFNTDKIKARNLIKKYFDNKKYKSQAFINYGYVLEKQGKYSEAEKYYKEAVKNNDDTGIVYLNNLYKSNKEKKAAFLEELKNNTKSFWPDYEKAAYLIENDETEKSIACLAAAIENGFSSIDLLQNDPAFNKVRDTKAFKELCEKIKKNSAPAVTMSEKLKQAEYEYTIDKPYGKIKNIDIAGIYESTGNDKEALKLLLSIVKSNPGFRDTNIACFRIARIYAKTKQKGKARKFVKMFIDQITGASADTTGYKDLVLPVYKDIIVNDCYLKDIAWGN